MTSNDRPLYEVEHDGEYPENPRAHQFEIGEVVQLWKDTPLLQDYCQEVRAASYAITNANKWWLDINDEFWARFRELYPELNDFDLAIKDEGKAVLIRGKATEGSR